MLGSKCIFWVLKGRDGCGWGLLTRLRMLCSKCIFCVVKSRDECYWGFLTRLRMLESKCIFWVLKGRYLKRKFLIIVRFYISCYFYGRINVTRIFKRWEKKVALQHNPPPDTKYKFEKKFESKEVIYLIDSDKGISKPFSRFVAWETVHILSMFTKQILA